MLKTSFITVREHFKDDFDDKLTRLARVWGNPDVPDSFVIVDCRPVVVKDSIVWTATVKVRYHEQP